MKYNIFNGEKSEQQATDEFEDAVGLSRARQMQRIWNNSYATRDHMNFMVEISKEVVFIKKAKAEGFSIKEINMFLDL